MKSANVLLDENRTALLTDFGLAKGRAYTVLTKAGQVMGTLDYLAPELIRGEQATKETDLYALGCVVFECLIGSPPFAGKPIYEVGIAHLEEPPPDPSELRPELPKTLGWAVTPGAREGSRATADLRDRLCDDASCRGPGLVTRRSSQTRRAARPDGLPRPGVADVEDRARP